MRSLSRRHAIRTGLASVLALLVLGGCVGFAADELKWYDRVEDALSAAKQSGRPVFVYIYSQKVPACQMMRTGTLRYPKVMALLQAYECCALDADLEANGAFVDRYTTAAVADENMQAQILINHGYLFLDSQGHDLYSGWGYASPSAFIEVLQAMPGVLTAAQQLLKTPDDPRSLADLGHGLLRLGKYKVAAGHLNSAIAKDPENKVGAKEDATLDLILLSIPDDPTKASDALAKFRADFPKTKRALEVRFYEAISLVAQGDVLASSPAPKNKGWEAKYREALKLLDTFKTNDRNRPEYNSEWTSSALGIRGQVRQALGMPRDDR